MNPTSPSPAPPGLPWVLALQVVLAIASLSLTQSFLDQEIAATVLVRAGRAFFLLVGLVSLWRLDLSSALGLYLSVALFHPVLPIATLYLLAFFLLGAVLLWFRAGLPRFGWLPCLFLAAFLGLVVNLLRHPPASADMVVCLATYCLAAAFLSSLLEASPAHSIHWRSVMLTIGSASSLTVLVSLAWVLYGSDTDTDALALVESQRLGPMGGVSSNSGAMGWGAGVLAWGVYAAWGGSKTFAIPGALVCLAAVALSRTVGASLALAICLPFVLYRLFALRGFLAALITVYFLAVLGALVSSSPSLHRWYQIESRDLETLSTRTVTWAAGLSSLHQYPLGCSWDEWQFIGPTSRGTSVLTPHNSVLQLGAFGGVAAFLAALAAQLLMLWRSCRGLRARLLTSVFPLYTILALLSIDIWYCYPLLLLAFAPLLDSSPAPAAPAPTPVPRPKWRNSAPALPFRPIRPASSRRPAIP